MSAENSPAPFGAAAQPAARRSPPPAAPAQPEDEDLALAKVLQQQERAFLALQRQQQAAARRPRAAGENAQPPAAPPAGRARALGDAAPAAAAAGAAPAEGQHLEEPTLTDEELALRLMAEEEAAFQARLLALAGAAPGEHGSGEGGGGEGDDGDDDEAYADPDGMSYEQLSALGDAVGRAAGAGLPPEALAALPSRPYAEHAAARGAGSGGGGEEDKGEEECAVCRAAYAGGDAVTALPRCGHVFHAGCIAAWLATKKACPLCGGDVGGGGD